MTRLRRSDLDHIVRAARPYTMVCDDGVRFTAQSAVRAVSRNVAGDMVECGTWRGGCALAMLLAQRAAFGRVERKVHLLDSFAGLPPAQPVDGPGALTWQARDDHDNCRASRDEVQAMLDKFDFAPTEYAIWPGWFSETLVKFLDESDQIAVLRLDGDWYDSTMPCLCELVPVVSDRGTVIVDDYYAWTGCARALHDYLSRNNLPYRVRSLPKCSGAYFIKTAESDDGSLS